MFQDVAFLPTQSRFCSTFFFYVVGYGSSNCGFRMLHSCPTGLVFAQHFFCYVVGLVGSK